MRLGVKWDSNGSGALALNPAFRGGPSVKRTQYQLGGSFRVILFISACILFLSPNLSASTLACKFTDQGGKTLKGVEVRLTLVASDDRQYQKSDKKGEVTFHDLKAGTYELMAQLKDYMPLKREVEFSKDQTLNQVLLGQKDFDQLEKEATDAIASGQFSNAVPVLDKLLAVYPYDAELHMNLGLAYAGLQQQEKALAEASKAAQFDPAGFGNGRERVEGVLLREQGQSALKNQDFAVAAAAFEKWVQLEPKNPLAYYGLALAYGHQEKFAQALTAINKALELDPQNDSYQKVKQVLEANAGGK
jgi:Flp pilus assembly protein TadD